MGERQALLRGLAKVDEVLLDERLFLVDKPRMIVVESVREVIDGFRQDILSNKREYAVGKDEIIDKVLNILEEKTRKNLRRVINATGVVLHTNLGRARLSRSAYNAILGIADSYCNLEYNLELGERGSRHDIVENLVKKVTLAEACMVVNNNAAATMLVLASMAEDREVIISRGELVEIGGSFRIPEVMTQSGAILYEVGATNKTRISDYGAAYRENLTAAIMKVHTSNYKIMGFTEEAELADLVKLGKEVNVPVIYDMGNGLMYNMLRYGVHEPTVPDAVKTGADIILFSGDKLLGGTQAGIIIGRKSYIDVMKKHPLARAFRVDKFTLAALEATFSAYLNGDKVIEEIPTLKMIALSAEELKAKAKSLMNLMKETLSGFAYEIESCEDQVGGGSAPTDRLHGYGISMVHESLTAQEIERRLRRADIPVIVRVNHDRIFVDVRTVSEDEYKDLIRAFEYALGCVKE